MMEETGTIDIKTINEKIEKESAFVDLLMLEMNKVIYTRFITCGCYRDINL